MTTLTKDLEALRTTHDEFSAILTALDAELAGMPRAMRTAAATGDGDEYRRLMDRMRELPDRLMLAGLAFDRTVHVWAQVAHAEREQRDEAALGSTPASQLETAGSPHVSHPVDRRVMLARLDGFLEALELAQRELLR